uniref:glucan endo-1,3-beta-D-glucosidase n=1 Tax=Amphora coffeiformis TaxID=265554 RepID=A0A7S3L7Q4_9STRA
MSTETFQQERRLVGETDSLVLEVDDIDDNWTDAGFPRDGLLSSPGRNRLKRVCLGLLGVTVVYLAVRRAVFWSNTTAPSSSNNVGSMPKNANSTSVSPTSSPTTKKNPPSPPASSNPLTESPVGTNTPLASPTQSPKSPESETTINTIQAFSVLDPVADLGILAIDRPPGSRPPRMLHKLKEKYGALPTNAWYQNMLMIEDNAEPVSINRAYAMPYVVDASGPIPGLRTIPGRLQVGDSTTEYIVEENFGLTLGLTTNSNNNQTMSNRRYMVTDATQLAVTLEWHDGSMASPIVRGMPYGTMIYEKGKLAAGSTRSRFPTIASELPVESIRIDNQQNVMLEDGSRVWIEHELQIALPDSDMTWLIFVSERVQIQRSPTSFGTVLQVVSWGDAETTKDLVLRVTQSETCSSGRNPVYCQQEFKDYAGRKDGYSDLLRKHAHIYPGPNASFTFDFFHTGEVDESRLVFNWDARRSENLHPLAVGDEEMLVFALPHHFDMKFIQGSPTEERFCWDSLLGWACAVRGSKWEVLDEPLTSVSFRALRPPSPWVIPALVTSLGTDIQYRIPDNYRRGAGDTYFSGKMLAKLARIMVILEEVKHLCTNPDVSYSDACSRSSLPDDESIQRALEALRESLNVWLGKTSEAPFVYDASWGGVPNCGCYFDGNGCGNRYPYCPALSDAGLNFGNGFYNDQHFHYGYFIYSAAVVAHFDPSWGKTNYENVLLLVRSIANPSRDDNFFPLLRHVDPFRGHSFASGITLPVFRNGRNQESSSEAIASYEAVALYGATMSQIFEWEGMDQERKSAEAVHSVGRTILSMELRSAKRYWHISHEKDDDDLLGGYRHGVVGILWQTMFQFQTFFGTAPYFVYGIQLLPLTPVSEQRDGLDWIRSMYSDFSSSCTGDCVSSGWSIQDIAVLATGGHFDDALDKVNALPDGAFETSGGNGHSRSNTLWWISTRPDVEDPISVLPVPAPTSLPAPTAPLVITCDKPETCTPEVLDNDAGGFSCGARIRWLITTLNFSEQDACAQVARDEYPNECNGC